MAPTTRQLPAAPTTDAERVRAENAHRTADALAEMWGIAPKPRASQRWAPPSWVPWPRSGPAREYTATEWRSSVRPGDWHVRVIAVVVVGIVVALVLVLAMVAGVETAPDLGL